MLYEVTVFGGRRTDVHGGPVDRPAIRNSLSQRHQAPRVRRHAASLAQDERVPD